MKLDDVVIVQLEFLNRANFTAVGPGGSNEVSLFETTIRYLGALISAYDLLKGPYENLIPSGKKILVDKLLTQATSLADNLKFAFNTASGIPHNDLDYSEKTGTGQQNNIAQIGTLVLEWTRLSDLTGNRVYADLTQKAESYLLNTSPASTEPFPGLITTWYDVSTGQGIGANGGWGGLDDSYYEYLLKMYIYDPVMYAQYGEKWIQAADSTLKHLKSSPTTRPDVTFVAAYSSANEFSLNSGNLNCFAGGNIMLGGEIFGRKDLVQFGKDIIAGCRHTYHTTVTEIGPESFGWDANKVPSDQAAFFRRNGWYWNQPSYNLRPEVIESYYYGWKLTGSEMYRDWAWEAFKAINASCRTEIGFSNLNNVQNPLEGLGGFQESYWFAETLKYFWIIFGGSDDTAVGVANGKQKWVFNTEAHPVLVKS
ncbi:glycoside hydrolase [Terfezia claveryi]|nr:glycoside hydrolase [Terfezia claveryi]